MSLFRKEPKIHILLIEDDSVSAELIRVRLRRKNRVFKVEVSTSLEGGILSYRDGNYDVVLLDLGLPDSKGLSTAETFMKAFPGALVIVLTADDDEEVAIKSVLSGAQDYLVKDEMRTNRLTLSIRNALGRMHRDRELQGAGSPELEADLQKLRAITEQLKREYGGR